MTYKFLGLLVGGVALLAGASPAMAAKVSVELEGQNVILAPTTFETAASATKPGGASCTGPVPATALETAVTGDWDGPAGGVTRIRTEDRPFAPGASSWAVYVNGKFIDDGPCAHTLADGDKVLFYWSDAFASEGYDEPVFLDASATAVPGQAFTVKTTKVDTTFNPNPPYDSSGTITPAAGATVSGGAATATTGADGTASVTVAAGGPYTLVAKLGNRAPARISGCATNGHDGFCGSSTSGGGQTTTTTTTTTSCVTNGRDGFCGTADKFPAYGKLLGITEGKKYKKGQGPRQLAGKVENDASGLADVRLRLTRTNGDACSTYDAKRERFKAMKKCGATHGSWFSVGAKSDWTYLLPSKLGTGRYVLDQVVVDKAGNKTTKLARGTSRLVFTVA
jgi:hypothetical protein